MANSHYELWRYDNAGTDDFFPADSESIKASLPADAQLIVTIEASSWDKAQQKRYDFMGWGHYRTLEEETNAT